MLLKMKNEFINRFRDDIIHELMEQKIITNYYSINLKLFDDCLKTVLSNFIKVAILGYAKTLDQFVELCMHPDVKNDIVYDTYELYKKLSPKLYTATI